MHVALRTSTGVEIEVWRDADVFHARRADHASEPETCWEIDLFEVIAELAELELGDPAHAAEAVCLAERAQHLLRVQ